MNSKLITLVGALTIARSLHTEYGCMAKSYHLSKLNDPKEYHYVTGPDGGPCPCPCSRYCAEYKKPFFRGQCPVCGHYRVPRPFIIVERTQKGVECNPYHPADIKRKRLNGKTIAVK